MVTGKNAPNAEHLRKNFTFLGITDEGLKDVAKLQKLSRLFLNSCEQITDEGLKEVAKLQHLIFLELDATKIMDAGLKELTNLKKLKILHLVDTKATSEVVAELQKALPNCDITGGP